MKIRTYQEMCKFNTFEERLEYLRLEGGVGHPTFGFDRYINQKFYGSAQWRHVRDFVIVRDEGCDLGIPDRSIYSGILIHHINPMVPEDIINDEHWILDPEFLVTTCHDTHNAIHYGGVPIGPPVVLERQPNDTKLW